MPDGGIATGPAILGAAGIAGLSSGLTGAFAGQRTSASQTNAIPPELAQLYGLQGQQYRQVSPLQAALQQGMAGAVGLKTPNPFAPALTKLSQQGITPEQALQVTQDYGKGIFRDPHAKDILLALDAYASTPNQLSNVLERGAPATVGTNQVATQLASELQQAMAQSGQPGQLSPQEQIYQSVDMSPLADALRGSLTLRPEETAYAGRVGEVADPLARALESRTSGFLSGMDDITRSVRGMTDNPLDTALLSSYAQRLPGIPQGANDVVNAPLDTASILNPLSRAFTETVAPEIRSAAIRYGSPGAGGEQELLRRAAGNFGSQASEALARQEINRRNQILQGAQLSTTATAQGGTLAQALMQGELNRRWQGLQGFDTAIKGQSAGMDAALRSTPLLQALLLAGPQAQAQLAGQQRQLAGARAQVPLNLIQGTNIQVPGVPNYPGSSVKTGAEDPSLLARIGEGAGGLGNAALLMALLGKGGGQTKTPMDMTGTNEFYDWAMA